MKECDERQILAGWKTYFQDLFGGKDAISATGNVEENKNLQQESEEETEDVPPPTKEEIKEILKNLKNRKAPGENGIKNELIKCDGEKCITQIYRLIQQIWQKEQMPPERSTAVITLVHKKGEK